MSPTGKPGGLAMRGKVRNWAYLVRGKPSFTRKMQPDPDSTGSRFGKAGSTTGAVAGSLIAPAPEAAPPTARPEPAPAPTAQLGARLRPVDVDPFEGARRLTTTLAADVVGYW